MYKKVPISELRHGMFVADLDRPWLDTPFLLQGLLIDSDEQLEQLCHYCKFVYIDVHRSVGTAYEAFPPGMAKRPRRQIPTEPPPPLIRRVAAHSPLTESSKSSLIGDIKTILRESFAARSEVNQTASPRNDAIDESPPFYHADNKSPTFNKTPKAKSKSRAPARKFERPSGADYLDEPLLIHGGGDRPGLLRQIVGLFSRPTATGRQSSARRLRHATGRAARSRNLWGIRLPSPKKWSRLERPTPSPTSYSGHRR